MKCIPVDPSAYLNTSGVSANDGDRSRESEDAVLRNAAEVDELVKRAQRETEGDAKAALAGIQNDEEVQKALANIRQQSMSLFSYIDIKVYFLQLVKNR